MEVELGELQKQIYREGTHTTPILKCGAFPPLLFFSRRLKKPKRRKSAALQSAGWPSREAELPNHYLINQFPPLALLFFLFVQFAVFVVLALFERTVSCTLPTRLVEFPLLLVDCRSPLP